MAALGSDEIQFLYCNADTNIVRIATGADGKLSSFAPSWGYLTWFWLEGT